MLITPDLSQATESRDDAQIPAGIYTVRVDSAEAKTTLKGEQRISWKLVIYGAEGELARFNNWPVFHSTMCVGAGAGMLKQFYKVCMGQELTGAFDATELYGKELQITLVEGKNKDGSPSKYPSVKGVKALTH